MNEQDNPVDFLDKIHKVLQQMYDLMRKDTPTSASSGSPVESSASPSPASPSSTPPPETINSLPSLAHHVMAKASRAMSRTIHHSPPIPNAQLASETTFTPPASPPPLATPPQWSVPANVYRGLSSRLDLTGRGKGASPETQGAASLGNWLQQMFPNDKTLGSAWRHLGGSGGVGKLGSAASGAAGHMGKMLDADSTAMGATSSAFGAAGSLAGAIPGPWGRVIGGLAKLGEVLTGAIDKLRIWGDKLHEGNMRFAEFSAAMTSVQVGQEVRDIEYSRERGEVRAHHAERLAEEKSRFRETFKHDEDAWKWMKDATGEWAMRLTRAMSTYQTGLRISETDEAQNAALEIGLHNPLLGGLLIPLKLILQQVEEMNGKIKDPDMGTMGEWFEDLGKKHWADDWGRPKGMPNPWGP